MADKKTRNYRPRVIKIFDGKDGVVMPKHGYAIGYIEKEMVYVRMFKEEEKGKVVYRKEIHTFKHEGNDEIKHFDEEDFNKIRFY